MVESLKDIAGTEFQRRLNESGDYPKEVLFSRGPLSETITVEVNVGYFSMHVDVRYAIILTNYYWFCLVYVRGQILTKNVC